MTGSINKFNEYKNKSKNRNNNTSVFRLKIKNFLKTTIKYGQKTSKN